MVIHRINDFKNEHLLLMKIYLNIESILLDAIIRRDLFRKKIANSAISFLIQKLQSQSQRQLQLLQQLFPYLFPPYEGYDIHFVFHFYLHCVCILLIYMNRFFSFHDVFNVFFGILNCGFIGIHYIGIVLKFIGIIRCSGSI